MKKSLQSLILMSVLILSMFLGVLFPKQQIIQAKTLDNVVDSLEIIGLEEEYFPGNVIYLKGHWQLEDDHLDKTYRAGDQFKVTVPEGLSPVLSTIQLGDMGEGVWDGSGFVFTFSENIEHLVGREGGFNIALQVDAPEEEGQFPRELAFEDGNGNTLLKESIVINNESREVGEETEEIFSKGAYSHFTENGIRWFIRVNRSFKLPDNKVTIVDRVLGDQRIVPGSFVIKPSKKAAVGDVSEEKYQAKEVLDPDLKGFRIELDLSDDVWYNIEYDTEYTGSDFDQEYLILENEVKAFGDKSGIIPLEHNPENDVAIAQLYLGGWGRGSGVKGTAKIIKKDVHSGRPLKGAEFQLTHVYDSSKTYTATSQENGEAIFEDIVDGLYYLKELKAPDNYELGEDRKVNIRFDAENDFVYSEEVTNVRKKLSFKGEKHWFDYNGKKIPSQKDVVLQLYGDGELKRQMVLPKGKTEFEFKNVPAVNSKGEDIEFEIKEIVSDGYEERVYYDEESGLWIVENKSKIKPEPPKPPEETPEEPPVDTPEEPPVDTPEEPPVETPEEPPVDTPEEPPVDTPEEPPVDTPEEPPVDTPEEPPVDTPEEPPVDTPEEPPVDTPEEPPVDTPEEPPVETPEEPPVDTPEEPPVDTPEEPGTEISDPEIIEQGEKEEIKEEGLPKTGMGRSPIVFIGLFILILGSMTYLKDRFN